MALSTLDPAMLLKAAPPAFNQLKITNNSTTPLTKIDITADTISMLNYTTAATFLSTGVAVTIDATVVGLNGLSTGTLAVGWYVIHAVTNGTTIGAILDVSLTAPTMPAGYTARRAIGAVYYTGATNGFVRFLQLNYEWQYIITASSSTVAYPQPVTGSNSGNYALASFTTAAPVSLGMAGVIQGWVQSINTVGTVGIDPSGTLPQTSGPSAPAVCTQVSGGPLVQASFRLPIKPGQTGFYYASTSTSGSCNIIGFTLNL